MGRRRSHPLRPDWEQVKDQVMLQCVLQKFETHADIRSVLLATGDQTLVENAPKDYRKLLCFTPDSYWYIDNKCDQQCLHYVGTGRGAKGVENAERERCPYRCREDGVEDHRVEGRRFTYKT